LASQLLFAAPLFSRIQPLLLRFLLRLPALSFALAAGLLPLRTALAVDLPQALKRDENRVWLGSLTAGQDLPLSAGSPNV
jgi:hypothetical protein